MSDVKTTESGARRLLVTRDPSLMEAVTATALALGAPVEVAGDREELRSLWGTAEVRLVGTDMASRAAMLPRVHTGVWVVGKGDAALLAASAELGAPALALPQASARLAEVLTRRHDPGTGAAVVALVGGSGGLGTSSIAVAVACLAAHRGRRVTAVELTECGGGLDLLLGLETAPGIRWGELAHATGELGVVADQLVGLDGASVLALDRDSGAVPTQQALGAVLRSLGRSQDLVVVDAGDGRRLSWLPDPQPVLLVAAHVRGVAAARMVARQQELGHAQLLVRRGPGSALPAAAVSEALGLPLLGVIRHDGAVPRLAASGASITSRPARRFRHDVGTLLDGLLQ